MRLRRKFLKSAKLYLILDTAVHDYRALFNIARQALKGGVHIFQLRDKLGSARDILQFSRRIMPALKDEALYIINDRLDLALLLDADGVHLGQEDIPVDEARHLAKKNMIIGTSCQSIRHVNVAIKDGVDYIGLGSVFKTKTKPDRDPMDLKLLRAASCFSDVPIFPIGGITQENVRVIQQCGIHRAAICRSISEASDVKKAVQFFRNALEG
ncbi:MAG: thiamine phosphate synthase [Candidatus Omnitrophica bacterium]|nr:thiamine phosphate synthase [Candidatus Omnitrophota bacterium]